MSSGETDELSPEGRTLLEKVQSEAKRLDRSEVDLACMAIALIRISSSAEELEAKFGEGFSDEVRRLTRSAPVVGDEDAVIDILIATDKDRGGSVATHLADAAPNLREELIVHGGEAPMTSSAQTGQRELDQEPKRQERSAGSSPKAVERPPEIEYESLRDSLAKQIRGQSSAIETVVRRLTITRAALDLRPERPDGVFMFAGPTGVGKTELAHALAFELMGDRDALIRLDMSEYAHDWSISRLTGPMPGYVGSDKPESWLTTKVIKSPNSVVLLDEVEKAHPAVWNVFLQAFDTGRLTDSAGKTASFSGTIVIMTSNLGAEVFTKRAVGFTQPEADESGKSEQESEGIVSKVRSALPPELMNRLDAVVPFRALEIDDIRDIAEVEMDKLVERLEARGIDLRVSREVRDLVCESNYDRRYGARHLQRNLEKILIEPLALSGIREGSVEATVEEGEVRISVPAGS